MMFTNMLRRAILVVALLSPVGAVAEPRPLLSIGEAQNQQAFSEADFAALTASAVTTHTPWTEGPHLFEGVLLRDALAAAGWTEQNLQGKRLELQALNDYIVEIDAVDAFSWTTLLARKMDGVELLRSDKGPIWLIYPRDDDTELHDRRYDHRWAWQLARITVK